MWSIKARDGHISYLDPIPLVGLKPTGRLTSGPYLQSSEESALGESSQTSGQKAIMRRVVSSSCAKASQLHLRFTDVHSGATERSKA